MEVIDYAETEAHKAVHNNFRERVQALNQQLQRDPSSITLDHLLSVAQQWFLQHILEEDLKIRGWLKASEL